MASQLFLRTKSVGVFHLEHKFCPCLIQTKVLMDFRKVQSCKMLQSFVCKWTRGKFTKIVFFRLIKFQLAVAIRRANCETKNLTRLDH